MLPSVSKITPDYCPTSPGSTSKICHLYLYKSLSALSLSRILVVFPVKPAFPTMIWEHFQI